MARARLVINGEREMTIGEGVASIGRALDNTIPLNDDSNVSRYHAEIEARDGEFWLIELGSSNGTSVGGVPVYAEKLLRDGDLIVFGGSSEILFELEKAASAQEEDEDKQAEAAPETAAGAAAGGAPNLSAPSVSAPAAPAAPEAANAAADTAKSKMPLLLTVAGVVCGLAIIFVVIAVAVSWSGGSGCNAKAKITSPEMGDTITKETEIEVDATNADCAKRAIFLIDGEEFASAEDLPYTATLDPKKFPQLSDGSDHTLKVVLEDEEGKPIEQSAGEVLLAFETLSTPTPTPEIVKKEDITPTPTPQKGSTGKGTSLIEIQNMSKRLMTEFSGNNNYRLDPQFLQEVQKRTAEYALEEGFYSRAEPFRDLINIEFHKENGLAPPLGFILAMSRSKFKPQQKQGSNEGLWQLSDGFVTGNNYKAPCVAESLSDPTQNCAAKSAALYSKALFSKIFDPNAGGLVYAVAAFGMTEGEASQWQSTLTGERADFWKNIRQPAQRELVVRFFAAGIVAENPQNFGMKRDRPISEFYKNLMAK